MIAELTTFGGGGLLVVKLDTVVPLEFEKNIDPQLENYTHSYIHKPYGHILFSYWCPIHIYLTKIQNKHIFQICTLSC